MSPLVVAGADIWHMGFWFEKAYEDQVVSQDEDFIIHCYDGTTDFSCEEFRQTLLEVKNIMNFAQNGWENTTDTQVADYLVNGEAAMLYSGTHMFSTLNDIDSNFEVGWFLFPVLMGNYDWLVVHLQMVWQSLQGLRQIPIKRQRQKNL